MTPFTCVSYQRVAISTQRLRDEAVVVGVKSGAMEDPVELEHVRFLIPFVLHARLPRHLDEAIALLGKETGGGWGGPTVRLSGEERGGEGAKQATLREPRSQALRCTTWQRHGGKYGTSLH